MRCRPELWAGPVRHQATLLMTWVLGFSSMKEKAARGGLCIQGMILYPLKPDGPTFSFPGWETESQMGERKACQHT